jgi:hypothetical protein
MIETMLVIGALILFGLVGWLGTAVSLPSVIELGLWALAIGLVTGLPTGFWYHVVLYRMLSKRMTLPRRWWLFPGRLHPSLAMHETARVRPWFLLGAFSFMLSLGGGMVALAGALLIPT